MTDFLKKKALSSLEIASVFDEASLWAARFGILLFNHLEIRRAIKIMDLGCATGFPLFELAQVHGNSCQITGVDIWKEALERAQSKLQTYGLSNVKLIEASGAQLPFKETEFDLIVSNLGINNFAEPQTVLGECFRVAKPGARLVLTTNLQGHFQEFYEVFEKALRELQKPAYLENLRVNEAHRGTKASTVALVQGAGFKVTKTVEDSFQMRYLDGTTLFNHTLTRLGFLDAWRGVVEPSDETEIFGLIESKLNEIATNNGELRMTVPMLYLEAEKPL